MQRYTAAHRSTRALLLYFSAINFTVFIVNKRVEEIVKLRGQLKQKAKHLFYLLKL